MDLLIIALVIYLIVKHNKQKQREKDAAIITPDQESNNKISNLDNDYFLIKDSRLLEYRGNEDAIWVPRGVYAIGGSDTRICNKTISHIYIPRTVGIIYDLALPLVEHVHFEGPREHLTCNWRYNFFADGWIPDWSKSDPVPVRVNNVTFDYNYPNYDKIEKLHYEKFPDELKLGKSTQ